MLAAIMRSTFLRKEFSHAEVDLALCALCAVRPRHGWLLDADAIIFDMHPASGSSRPATIGFDGFPGEKPVCFKDTSFVTIGTEVERRRRWLAKHCLHLSLVAMLS